MISENGRSARFGSARLWPIVILVLCAGCARKEVIEFNDRFSYNVVKVPDWFPGKQNHLSPAQEEVFARKGAPNFIRFCWNEDGSIVSSSDFSGKRDELPNMIRDAKRTWIYTSGKEKCEVEFTANGSMQHPLTDKLALLCRYGDPRTHSPPKPDAQGRMVETWIWTDQGKNVTLADDKIIKMVGFQGTGEGTIFK